MALCSRLCFYLFLGALLPTFASCIRPFRVPRNLFVQGTSPFTLPEGAREIQREGLEHDLENPQELVEDIRGRFRRASPERPPQPEKSSEDLAKGFDTLYMYWPRNSEKENYVFLLAKNTKKATDRTVSKVYVSKNYGKNFTDLNVTTKSGKAAALIDQIYSSKAEPKLCILADKLNKVLYRSEDLENFPSFTVPFVPSFITFHPSDARYVMAYDSSAEKLYWSNDRGQRFNLIPGSVKSFHWGVVGVHNAGTVFVETFHDNRDTTKDNRTAIYKVDNGQIAGAALVDNVEEFEMMKNYMFITTRKNPSDKNPILKVSKIAQGVPISFKETQFPSNEEKRDFFVFDVVEDYVFVVINHQRNSSNMYLSDTDGVKYQLSLPRVLYHNPYTDVSSPWLRTVIPYAFVDVDRIKGMRGIYIATQLTPGPVGKRHLLSLITYNRGGKWQRVHSPTVDIRGVRINCYLPSCSIHLNLLYGAVYRVSPSDRLFSSESAPGLVLGLGVSSTNLKIYPDLFMSLDGGRGWSRVLRGKYLFTFGDHGGVIIAVPYRRYTRSLRYSSDGGATWATYVFSESAILARDVVTQPGERLPIFLIYGTKSGTWTVFYLNMTSVLGPVCDSSAYTTWNDGCVLGRQQQLETRNFTIHCHMGREYKRPTYVRNCPCTRDDFQCDYGFQRKAIDEECTPIRQGVDLNSGIIPENCPEGTNYSRTQGFRKIPGDTCENGTESDFLPVSTPCPVKELFGLTLNCSNVNEDGIAAIETGATATFKAGVQKGYYPNINFKWFYGDGDDHVDQGAGMDFAARQHKYDKPGKYIVSVVASNTRSTLVARVELNVQEKIVDEKVTVNFNPKKPGVNDDVIFSANLNYSNEQVGNVHYKWKYDDAEIQGWQPVATLRFKKSQTYTVHITAKNYISRVKKTATVQVIKDLTPVNVTASVLGPSRVLVQWKPPMGADSSIKYKVYQSTSGNVGYKESSCAVPAGTSCIVAQLTPATTYYFKVQGYTSPTNTGEFSNLAVATTNTSTPGAPVEPRAFPVSSSIISVLWKPPPTPNGKITSYIIQYWSHQNPTVVKVDNGLKLSRNITGLTQDTFYFFEVYAQSTTGRSAAAGPVQALTKLSKPTLPPRDIKKVSDNGTCAMLTWKAPFVTKGDNRVLFPAEGYKVQVKVNSQIKAMIDAATTYAIVCQLSPGTVYNVDVWAYSRAGSGPPTSITLTTQTIKPGAPRNVRATVTSPTEVKLVWDAPIQSSAGVTGYEIYQISPYKAEPYKVTADLRTYTVGGLEPYTTYQFSISAKNSLGSSIRSAVVKVKTSENTPGVVRYVTAQTIVPRSASIKITWSTPDYPNGVIKEYRVNWGKTVVDKSTPSNTLIVNGSTNSYTFKNLFSRTVYSFIVFPVNNVGRGSQHIDPVQERTFPALKDTERLQVQYSGPLMGSKSEEVFIQKFIQAASTKAGIRDDRLAAVVVGNDGMVQFDLIPPLDSSGVSMKKAKSALNGGFKAADWTLAAGSLTPVFVYEGGEQGPESPSPAEKPTVAAQRGGGSSGGSSKKTYLAIAVPLALIGIALLGGMIFYYMKYKSLEKNYRKMDSQQHEEDEMKVVYHGDMQADSPDVIFGDHSRRGRKAYKDSEKVPLGDSDELAMI